MRDVSWRAQPDEVSTAVALNMAVQPETDADVFTAPGLVVARGRVHPGGVTSEFTLTNLSSASMRWAARVRATEREGAAAPDAACVIACDATAATLAHLVFPRATITLTLWMVACVTTSRIMGQVLMVRR